jgi:hypothetical protein
MEEGTNRRQELLALRGEGILDSGRDLGKSFSLKEPLSLHEAEGVGEGLWADPFQPRHQFIEPEGPVIPDGIDDQESPFLGDGIDDPLEGAEADAGTLFRHSYFITINFVVLILSMIL